MKERVYNSIFKTEITLLATYFSRSLHTNHPLKTNIELHMVSIWLPFKTEKTQTPLRNVFEN